MASFHMWLHGTPYCLYTLQLQVGSSTVFGSVTCRVVGNRLSDCTSPDAAAAVSTMFCTGMVSLFCAFRDDRWHRFTTTGGSRAVLG